MYKQHDPSERTLQFYTSRIRPEIKEKIDQLPDDAAIYLAIRSAKLPSGEELKGMECDYACDLRRLTTS